jgi:hypothetical protein
MTPAERILSQVGSELLTAFLTIRIGAYVAIYTESEAWL